VFKSITGFDYTNDDIALTEEQLYSIPDVRFTLNDTNGKTFGVTMQMQSYVEDVSQVEGGNLYAMRLFFTEKIGAVLGASFMTGASQYYQP
jgi:hypothetical protein